MRNVFLSMATLSFTVIIGAAIYEHLTMVPKWSASPPFSLSMFQGQYGIDSGKFWIPIHPLTLALLIVSLILHRRTGRRNAILTVLCVYVAILIITFAYFVPELLTIIHTPFEQTIDSNLRSRASLWETLSLVRLAVLIPLAFILIHSLTKPLLKA